jgi:hypothetical protein
VLEKESYTEAIDAIDSNRCMVLAQDYCNTFLTLRGGGVEYVNSIAISVDREDGMQGQQSSQSSFPAMIYEELIPTNHLLRRLSAAVDFSFVPDLVSDCYSSDNGRRTRACGAVTSGPPRAIQSRVSTVPLASFRPADGRSGQSAPGLTQARDSGLVHDRLRTIDASDPAAKSANSKSRKKMTDRGRCGTGVWRS